jgi:hypothetical protein
MEAENPPQGFSETESHRHAYKCERPRKAQKKGHTNLVKTRWKVQRIFYFFMVYLKSGIHWSKA